MYREKLKEEILEQLNGKPEITAFADKVAANTEIIPILLEIMKVDTGSIKFFCDKVIRRISEKQPLLIYPYFDEVAGLIDSSNNFIKWGAIVTLSNLISADTENKFDAIYEKYFDLINSDSMITAANVVGNAWKFILKNHGYEKDITRRLLGVLDNTYLYKGEPSPECKNVITGHVLDSFDKYFEVSGSKKEIIEFAESQRRNSRKQVAKKADVFIKKHSKLYN